MPATISATTAARTQMKAAGRRATRTLMRRCHVSHEAGDRFSMTFSLRDALAVLLAEVRSEFVELDEDALSVRAPEWPKPLKFRPIIRAAMKRLNIRPPEDDITEEVKTAAIAALRQAIATESSWDPVQFLTYAKRLIHCRLQDLHTRPVQMSANNNLMGTYLINELDRHGCLVSGRHGQRPSIVPEALGIVVDEALVQDLAERLAKRLGFAAASSSTSTAVDPVATTAVNHMAELVIERAQLRAEARNEPDWSAVREKYLREVLVDNEEEIKRQLVEAFTSVKFMQLMRDAFKNRFKKTQI